MNHEQKSETAIYSNFVKVNNSHTNYRRNHITTVTNDVFQKYTIVQTFGSGSMGAVYKVKLKHDAMNPTMMMKQREAKRNVLFSLFRNSFLTTTGTQQQPPSQPTTTTTTTTAPSRDLLHHQEDDERQRDREVQVGDNGNRNKIDDKGENDMVNDVDGKSDGDDDNDYYAVKCIAFDRISKEFINELQNEIRILKNMDHPNIVKAYEVFYENTPKKKRMTLTTTNTTDDDPIKMVYVVMELCTGGDLYSRTPYSEKEAAKIITQLLSAVWYVRTSQCMGVCIVCVCSMYVVCVCVCFYFCTSPAQPSTKTVTCMITVSYIGI